MPCYNAKKYLKQAVDSVLNQTFQDFEIILVDDGSTDETYDIMKSIWGDLPQVRVAKHTSNKGLNPTRNYGIRLARGRYIAFLDSDDCYRTEFLSTLYCLAEEQQADVVTCMGFFHSGNEIIPDSLAGNFIPELDSDYKNDLIIAPDSIKERMDGWLRNEYSIASWNKLYRRDFLIYHDLTFRPASDDRGFVFACLLYAKRYVKTPYIGNIYRSLQVSLSRNPNNKDMDKLEECIAVFDGFANDFMDTMKDFSFFEECPEYATMVIAHQLSILDRAGIRQYFPNSNSVDGNVYRTVHEALKKIFSEHAPLAEFLFLQYQTQKRRIEELQIREQGKT